MGQYKFKCPICGKWNDIIMYDMDYWAALCDSHAEDNIKPHRFEVAHRTLVKVIKILYNLGIYVAEVCDKVRWKRPNVVFDSSLVWRGYGVNGKKYYYMVVKHGESNYIASRLNCRKPIKRTCKTLKSAKAACQADFQKRRAK